MMSLRRANERGQQDFGWLETKHTFSFGHYHDPEHTGFRALRVINEDRVRAGEGFGTHGHDNMEIISYVVGGTLAHKDSMGSLSELRPGDLQVMSAGTGITHSEFNSSESDSLHFLQIWILPEERNREPRYAEQHFPVEERRGALVRAVGPDGSDAPLTVGQDASLYVTVLGPEESVEHSLEEGRHAWVQVVAGSVEANGLELSAGDGLAVSDESKVVLTGSSTAELLLFDLG